MNFNSHGGYTCYDYGYCESVVSQVEEKYPRASEFMARCFGINNKICCRLLQQNHPSWHVIRSMHEGFETLLERYQDRPELPGLEGISTIHPYSDLGKLFYANRFTELYVGLTGLRDRLTISVRVFGATHKKSKRLKDRQSSCRRELEF